MEKKQICEALAGFCKRYGSQNRAAAMLKGVSAATVSQMLNGKWEAINDEMWRNVASEVATGKQWQMANTTVMSVLGELLCDAQQNANVYAVIGAAGCGKTATVESYRDNNPASTFVVHCGDYWNKRLFLSELLRSMGRDASGANIGDMVAEVIAVCKRADRPLIVLDEADKLSDPVLYFFITLYNALEDVCGIVLLSTEYLEKRITKGMRTGRKGYREIFSRIGGRFVHLPVVNAYDVRAVCDANGVFTDTQAKSIMDDCGGDMRRVKRLIHAQDLKAQGK